MPTPRTGMLGALMDEYERASIDLKSVLSTMSQEDFVLIRDTQTKDEDCRSNQTIMQHVVRSGYTYANYMLSVFSKEWNDYTHPITDPAMSIVELDKMLAYTDRCLQDKYDRPMAEIESWKFHARWGVDYDIEQLLEHAIVHILRHRRQIENFLRKV